MLITVERPHTMLQHIAQLPIHRLPTPLVNTTHQPHQTLRILASSFRKQIVVSVTKKINSTILQTQETEHQHNNSSNNNNNSVVIVVLKNQLKPFTSISKANQIHRTHNRRMANNLKTNSMVKVKTTVKINSIARVQPIVMLMPIVCHTQTMVNK